MLKSLNTTKKTQTLDQAVAKWFKLTQEDREFLGSIMEFFKPNLPDFSEYKKKLLDTTEAICTIFYPVYEKICNANPLARPFLLKYILDKERDFIEEIITESFLESLVQKINKSYESNIRSETGRLTNLQKDKNNLVEPDSQELISNYEQNLAQIQTEIDKTKQDIKAIQNTQKQLATYNTYTDKIKAREKILLHAKTYNSDILHDMLSAEIEEKFTGYLRQLDVEKVREKYCRIIKKFTALRQSSFLDNVRASTVAGGISASIGIAIGYIGAIIFLSTSYYDGLNTDHPHFGVYPLIFAAVVCIAVSFISMLILTIRTFILKSELLTEVESTVNDSLAYQQSTNLLRDRKLYFTSKFQETNQKSREYEASKNNDTNLNTTQDDKNIYPNLNDMKESVVNSQKNIEFQNNLEDASIIPSAPLAETEVTNIVISTPNYIRPKVKCD